VLIEHFLLSITVPELSGEMCARLFSQGVDLFALKFYLDRVVSIDHSWHQKTRNTGLPNGENHIPLHSVVLTQYWSVTDRRTADRQTDTYAVAHTTFASFAACCKNDIWACFHIVSAEVF